MSSDQKAVSAPVGELLFGRESSAWWGRLGRFLYLAVQEFNRNRCSQKAASLGFQTVLSFVPALVLSVFFIGAFGGIDGPTADLPRHLLHQLNVDKINLTMPGAGAGSDEVQVKLADKIEEIVESAVGTLRSRSVSLTSLLGLILTSIFLTLTLENSLNDIWSSHGRRSLVSRVAMAWAMLTLAPFLLAVSLYVTHGLDAPPGLVDFGLRMVMPLLSLFLLYWIVPAAPVAPRAALLGAGVGAAGWVLARKGFAYYLIYAVHIDKLYGAIGLLPIFLIWVWLGWMIVLTGAEVCYTHENLTRLTAHERRRRLAPFVQPGLAALAAALLAAEAFRDGRGPVAREELLAATGLPDRLWERLSALLIERRVLVEAGREGRAYSLGRPPEQIVVDDVFSAVEEALVARPEEGSKERGSTLKDVSRQLLEARRRELGRKTIAELLSESRHAA